MELTPDQLAEMDRIAGITPPDNEALFAEMDAALQQPAPQQSQQKTIAGNLANNLQQRGKRIFEQYPQAVNSGQETPFERVYKTVGQGFGAAGDLVGAGLSAADYALGGAPSGAANTLLENLPAYDPTGEGRNLKQMLGQETQMLGAEYGKFAQANPRAAGLLEATGNIVGGIGIMSTKPAQTAVKVATSPVTMPVKSTAKGLGNIATGIAARGEDAIKEGIDLIKNQSRDLYQYADNAGVMIAPQESANLVNKLASVVKSDDIASRRLYSSTLGAIKDATEDIAQGNTGLMTLDRHRQILGNIAKDINNPNMAQEAQAASKAIETIDDFVENLTPQKLTNGSIDAIDALGNARKTWSKSKRFQAIGNIVVNSAGDANKLKRDLEKFRINPKNTMGWSKEEIDALKFASKQTTGEGMLKLLGKFGFDLGSGRAVGNGALPVLGSAIGGAAAGSVGIGAAIPIAGTVARTSQKALAAGKAEKLLKTIERNK